MPVRVAPVLANAIARPRCRPLSLARGMPWNRARSLTMAVAGDRLRATALFIMRFRELADFGDNDPVRRCDTATLRFQMADAVRIDPELSCRKPLISLIEMEHGFETQQ